MYCGLAKLVVVELRVDIAQRIRQDQDSRSMNFTRTRIQIAQKQEMPERDLMI